MPYIQTTTNVKIDAKKAEVIKAKFGKAIEAFPGKTEAWLMLSFEDEKTMYFKGSDGKIYSHIIDPRDGYPVDNGIKSVTIVSENGLKSDCLSTALFVMGKDKAVDYLRKNKNFEYVILTDNEAFVSEGLKDSFTLSSAGYAVRVIEKDD